MLILPTIFVGSLFVASCSVIQPIKHDLKSQIENDISSLSKIFNSYSNNRLQIKELLNKNDQIKIDSEIEDKIDFYAKHIANIELDGWIDDKIKQFEEENKKTIESIKSERITDNFNISDKNLMIKDTKFIFETINDDYSNFESLIFSQSKPSYFLSRSLPFIVSKINSYFHSTKVITDVFVMNDLERGYIFTFNYSDHTDAFISFTPKMFKSILGFKLNLNRIDNLKLLKSKINKNSENKIINDIDYLNITNNRRYNRFLKNLTQVHFLNHQNDLFIQDIKFLSRILINENVVNDESISFISNI